MSSPPPHHDSAPTPKATQTSTPGQKASDDRVPRSTSIFGPFTIPNKPPAPEPKKSLNSNTSAPPPGTMYHIKAIYSNAPSKINDFNDYCGTHARTKEAFKSLIDQARTGYRTSDEGAIEYVEGSECNVRVAVDGMSFEVFVFDWERWVARVWAEEKDGDGREYHTAFGW